VRDEREDEAKKLAEEIAASPSPRGTRGLLVSSYVKAILDVLEDVRNPRARSTLLIDAIATLLEEGAPDEVTALGILRIVEFELLESREMLRIPRVPALVMDQRGGRERSPMSGEVAGGGGRVRICGECRYYERVDCIRFGTRRRCFGICLTDYIEVEDTRYYGTVWEDQRACERFEPREAGE